MRYEPHRYQVKATERILKQERIGLFLDMGLGKTVITLTAIQQMLVNFMIYKILVIAPKRVAEDTWSREHKKWDHLSGLRISKVLGDRKQRIAALKRDADIYVIGRDNVKWLVEYMDKSWPFDMVVIDELSSFKNPSAQRFKALRKVIPASDRVVGLTGTPTPNGLIDLWSQIYLLDQGERLGRTVGSYRDRYFKPGAKNGHIVYRWELRTGAAKAIEGKLKDLCISMSAEDYLDMPERIDNVIHVGLTDKEREIYQRMELTQLVTIDGSEVAAFSAGAVMNKLLQMANGAVYDDNGDVIRIHERKLDALEELMDVSDEPILVFYSYKHDLAAIRGRFPDVRMMESADDIAAWNDGRIRLLAAHPASVGYGLNIQDGGHIIVWYGLPWSLELYQQANARLYRQGQSKTVIIHHLVADDTVDEQVMKALERKDTGQSALLTALKERGDQYDRRGV